MTPEQRQVCDANLARLARTAEPLGLNISARKKAAYDRWVCEEVYRHAGVPPMTLVDPDDTGPTGYNSNGKTSDDRNPGMGFLPRRGGGGECPPEDR
jgi:hypothetical protein